MSCWGCFERILDGNNSYYCQFFLLQAQPVLISFPTKRIWKIVPFKFWGIQNQKPRFFRGRGGQPYYEQA